MSSHDIPEIDLVIVDLYPFEETVKAGGSESEIIEKIDIGGISLIRAAAKNFKDVMIVSSRNQYPALLEILKEQKGETSLEDRKLFAGKAFNESSHYDTAIFEYFAESTTEDAFKQSIKESRTLRYGENPHQKGQFFGNLDEILEQLHGKAISYNNLLDIDAAVNLMGEFKETAFAVMKHNNACGLALRENLTDAWNAALAGDPVSAFGGVLITNREVDAVTAEEINKIFFEVIIAPSYSEEALTILKQKKNRIILVQKAELKTTSQFRTALNGVLVQDKDNVTASAETVKVATVAQPSQEMLEELLFAEILVKHTKSNAIILTKNKQLCASGTGQTSRVDALRQAIEKAKHFKFDINGAVMASDAFFPFADCVEIACEAGVVGVIQPGGSIRDKDSVEFCDNNKMTMVLTGNRHFKH